MKKAIFILIFILCAGIFFSGCVSSTGNTIRDCAGREYYTSNQTCCNGQVYDGTLYRACMEKCYNYTTHSCCNGEIMKGKWDSCDGVCYNKSTHSCCNGEIMKGKWDSCNGTCYDTSSHSCVNGSIREGRYCGEKKCRSVQYKCCNDKDLGPTCYDPKKSICLISVVNH
jgi:hypothetical protein